MTGGGAFCLNIWCGWRPDHWVTSWLTSKLVIERADYLSYWGGHKEDTLQCLTLGKPSKCVCVGVSQSGGVCVAFGRWMQTLFNSIGLEEKSLCPQQLSRRKRRRMRRERRSKGGGGGKEEAVWKWVGVLGRSKGGWEDRKGSKKRTYSWSHKGRKKGNSG